MLYYTGLCAFCFFFPFPALSLIPKPGTRLLSSSTGILLHIHRSVYMQGGVSVKRTPGQPTNRPLRRMLVEQEITPIEWERKKSRTGFGNAAKPLPLW
ncbi:hypothetical protein F4778DRAFT_132054 [Xylariomycetidae sp. FL2044]|nr:hypothetical protein F4778DRAFT_132054 [Xylariomycetidae sp. FL2044]